MADLIRSLQNPNAQNAETNNRTLDLEFLYPFINLYRAIHDRSEAGPFVPYKELRPIPGDLIEVRRDCFSHWALCYGKDEEGFVEVVHCTVVSPIDKDAEVVIERLGDYAGKNGFVRVNNLEVEALIRGADQSRPFSEIRQVVGVYLGQKVEYSVLGCNCEHYVTEWKYGISFSTQATLLDRNNLGTRSMPPQINPPTKETDENEELTGDTRTSSPYLRHGKAAKRSDDDVTGPIFFLVILCVILNSMDSAWVLSLSPCYICLTYFSFIHFFNNHSGPEKIQVETTSLTETAIGTENGPQEPTKPDLDLDYDYALALLLSMESYESIQELEDRILAQVIEESQT